MSRPAPFQRYGTEEHDVETIPLSSATAHSTDPPWYQDRDVTDEQLPSYNEALEDPPPSAGPRVAPSNPFHHATDSDPSHIDPPGAGRRPGLVGNRKRLNNILPCLLAPLIALIICAVFSGTSYVNAYGSPHPGLSSPATISTNKTEFLISTLIWAFIAYPFVFAFLVLVIPQIFGLPKTTDNAARLAWRDRHKHANRTCCTLYCGLTVLYFAIIGVTIWAVFDVAGSKWQQSFQTFQAEEWAGKYVIVAKTWNGSTGTLFLKNGQEIGQLEFTELATQWSMALSPPIPASIDNVVFTNVTNLEGSIGFNATCFSLNRTIVPCMAGGLEQFPPLPYYDGSRQVAEYAGNLVFNITPTNGFQYQDLPPNGTEITTWGMQYQGIGVSYPPLGTWSVNNNTLLDVMWSMNSSTACAGLRVNLSSEEEMLTWPVLGLIWQWWVQWGEGGGCSWS